ncbi:BglG family transcription antiterminator [Eubacterium multiforme]|uniref:Transcriptional antiterminator/mannitol/fructose-specific phosphotransferase system IIA component (Ntr-type) n=1 Tax=Eubacterium multiforme TaxID=83339 RepID=A0ABT9UVL6_9FIRM|nr:BglG family transcription antiterminator [Eubacterium multiforme]MDQ0150355.1 transcriptional antiterminator/mannitol/fructose-specific phosphotransferase system IIA component (Ntr-type) [Eubacterium multiforme]
MELNKDCIQILQYLVEKNDFVEIDEIAKKYKVTNRAIRYKIDKIEKFLLKNGFGYLDRKYKKGIRVPEDKNLKNYLNKFVGEYTPYKYVYSKEERYLHMLLKLLQSDTPVKIRFFEEKLCVSKNTLLKELDSIGEWLKERNLTLVRKPKIGMIVEGNEIDKRNAVVKIISQSTSSEDLLNYVSRKSIQSKINNLQFDTLFSDIDIDFIDGLIKRAEIELKREFSDEAYGGLITHLSIMIKRVQLNKEIYLPNINEDIVKETKEYEVSKNIIEKIESHYNIKVPECEISYIVIHLLGAKVLKNISSGESKYKDSELNKVVNLMTDYIEMSYGIKFAEEEKEGLIEGLILHLRPSIYRIKYGSNLINPLFDKIKTKYQELFKIVKASSKYLEEFIGSPLSEHEISYIVLHYGAALRLYEQRKSKKAKVIIVCGTGIGTSKMIAASIYEKFQVEILGTYASRNIDSNIVKSCDYIISTIDIPTLERDEYIKITPLLSEKDYVILNKHLLPMVKKEDCTDEIEKANRLIDTIRKYCNITDEEQLKYEILYELKRKEEKFPEEKRDISLSEFLRKETIELKLNCKDFEDVILKGVEPLERKGYITEKYGKEIIKNLKALGPYMVIAPGVCLAHANLPEEINKTSMSFINLKYPIKFNSKFNDPVKIVLTFATKDKESHLHALSQFMDIINNPNELQKLMNASSKDEVLKVINKY